MKRCPECRRDYFDDSLLYCLDDGSMLLEGPGSFEPRTEMIPGDSQRGQTIHTSETKVFSSDPAATVPKPSRTPLIAAAVAGVALLSAAGYGVYRLANASSAPPPAQRSAANIEVQRLTGDGKARGAIISPDGKLVAYVRTEGGERSIWLKQIATNSAIQLVKKGDLDEFDALTFSPDGTFLYFSAKSKSEEPLSVYRIPSLGGTPTKAVNDTLAVRVSPDGKQLSFGRLDLKTNEIAYFVANTDGSNERKITTRTGDQFFENEHAWSPDGKSLLLVAGDDSLIPQPNHSIMVVPIDGGAPTEIGERWGGIGDLVWHPSGDSILIAGRKQTAEQSQIWEISYPDGAARRITNNLYGHIALSITADGKAIVTGEIFSRTALWVSPDLKAENAKPIMPATADSWGFDWTPDGRIVFSSDRSGEAEIWVIDADGANAKQLTNEMEFKQVPVASPDGKYIVYSVQSNGGQIVRINADGTGRRVLVTAPDADNPDISRDSKWVLYSAYSGGELRVLRVSIDGGEPQQLTSYKAGEPRYSRDGTKFACFMPNERTDIWTRIAIVAAEGGEPLQILEGPQSIAFGRGPAWTPDDKNIVVNFAEGEKQNLWIVPLDGKAGRPLTDLDVPGIARREYSPDGKQIAVVRAEGIGNAIMITNFR